MTMPVTPMALPKMFSWASALRPTVASSTSRVSCGASGSSFFTTRIDLGQFVHQALLVLQPAGGVDQHHVVVFGLGALDRLEGQAGGVGARAAAR